MRSVVRCCFFGEGFGAALIRAGAGMRTRAEVPPRDVLRPDTQLKALLLDFGFLVNNDLPVAGSATGYYLNGLKSKFGLFH